MSTGASTDAGTTTTTSVAASWNESLSISMESQQPGPSGLAFSRLSLPFQQARMEQPHSSAGYHQRSSEPTSSGAPLFQVPPSQDILRDSLSQDSLGFGGGQSQNNFADQEQEESGNLSVADNLLQLSERARAESQERQLRESQDLSGILSQDRPPPRDATPPLLGGGEAAGEGHSDDDDNDDEDGGVREEVRQAGRGVMGRAGVVRLQETRSHVYNVPSLGGTDSEGGGRGRSDLDARGVPEFSSGAGTRVIGFHGDQAMPSTATSDSDLPACLEQRPSSQKVPNLSTRRLREMEKRGDLPASGVQPSPLITAARASTGTGATNAAASTTRDHTNAEKEEEKGPYSPVLLTGIDSSDSSIAPATQTTSSYPSDVDHASSLVSMPSRTTPANSEAGGSNSKNGTPLALQSPSPPTAEINHPATEAVPSTLLSERLEYAAGSQEHETPQEDLGNQLPEWCAESATRTTLSRHNSSSSSDSHNGSVPPPKRRRDKSRSSSSSDVPGWQKDGSSDVQVGSSGQAQPTTVPPSMPVGDSGSSFPVTAIAGLGMVGRSTSQQSSSGSSVQPSSSPHTGSSLGISSSLSPSLRKADSSQSEQLSVASPPAVDRNLSSSSHTDDAAGMSIVRKTEGEGQLSSTCPSHREAKSKSSHPDCRNKSAKNIATGASQSLECIASELFQDSLFSNSNTEEFVDVEGGAKKTIGSTPLPFSSLARDGKGNSKEDGKEEDDSLTQLQETPDISPSSDVHRRMPAFPLRSPAKISFEHECSSDATEAMEEDTSPREREGRHCRAQTPLRLLLTQSQASQSMGVGEVQEDGIMEEENEVDKGEEEMKLEDSGKGQDSIQESESVHGDQRPGNNVAEPVTSEGKTVSEGSHKHKSSYSGEEEEEEGSQLKRCQVPGIKPLYESLQYEDSTENIRFETPPIEAHPLPVSQVIQSSNRTHGETVTSDSKTSEPEAIDIAQINSGSFHFQLPNDSLLEPITSITPNPASTKTSPIDPRAPADFSVVAPATSATIRGRLPPSSVTGRPGRTASLSPSAVGKDFFTRSVTPSQQTDSAILREETMFQERDGSEDDNHASISIGKESFEGGRRMDYNGEGHDGVRGQLSEDLFASCTDSNKLEELDKAMGLPTSVVPPARGIVDKDSRTSTLITSSPVIVGNKEGTGSVVEDGEKRRESQGAFQLGLQGQQNVEESNLDHPSPPLLPQLKFPSDTQFELSEDVDVGNVGLNRSTTSETSEDRGPTAGKSSLFSDVITARRQKADVGKGSPVITPLAASERKRQRDPYQFSQDESQDQDMQVIMDKMRSRKKQRDEAVPMTQQPDPGLGVGTTGAKPTPTGVSATSDEASGHLPVLAMSPSSRNTTSERSRSPSLEVEQLTSEHASEKEDVSFSNVPPTTHVGGGSDVGVSKGCGPIPIPSTKSLTIPVLSRRTPSGMNTLSPAAGIGPGGRRSPGMSQTGRRSPFSPLRSPGMSKFPGQPLPSPHPSIAPSQFVSPSRTISSEGFRELKRNVDEREGREVSSHELRYVHTVCTVIEERFISSELVEDGVVVAGSDKFWPESSRPYTSQEIKVELLPRSRTSATPGSPTPSQLTPHQPSPSIILSPFTRRHPSPSSGGGSFSHLKVHPSSSHPFPSSGHGPMGGTPHPLPSPLATSHRPTAATSSSKETTVNFDPIDDGGGTILKLDDVPASRREKNGEKSEESVVSAIELASRASSSSSSGLATPTKDVTFVTDSSASPEDVGKKTNKTRGKGGRNKRSYSIVAGKKATTGFPTQTRRTSKSAFKVGTRLSLRTSPRKSVWEEKYSSSAKSTKVGSAKGKKLSFGTRKSQDSILHRIPNLEAVIAERSSASTLQSAAVPSVSKKGSSQQKMSASQKMAIPQKEIAASSKNKSPREEAVSAPSKGNSSQEGKSRTPRQEIASPSKSRTPRQEIASPSKSRTPRQEIASPSKSRTPRQEIASPSKSRTPRQEIASPSKSRTHQQETTSSSKTRNPRQKINSPSKMTSPQDASSSNNAKSPLKRPVKPKASRQVKESASPAEQLHSSPSVSMETIAELPSPAISSSTSGASGSHTPTLASRGRRTRSSGTPSSTVTGNSSSNSLRADYSVGDAVIARWMVDKRWYAATVKDCKNGRVHLHYADGEKGSVAPSQLFSQSQLRQNEPVLAGETTDSNLSEVSGLFESFSRNGKHFTMVTSEGKRATFEIGCFSISSDTALDYVKLKKSSPSSRKRMTPNLLEKSPLTKKRKVAFGSPSVMSMEDEEIPITDLPSSSQHCLFQGYSFFLTQKSKEDKQSGNREGPTLSKQQIHSLVTDRKGRILETYKDERITDNRYFVLSDDCCRTHKFLLGLALAIPCVSYNWITDCVQQGVVIDYSPYRLPAGIPHKSNVPIKWTHRERSSILRGVQVYVHHHMNDFKEHWRALLKYSGATILTKLPTASRMKSDKETDLNLVVVTEEGCHFPASLSRCTGPYNVVVLGPEWVVQCLVQGRHLRRYHDFTVELKS